MLEEMPDYARRALLVLIVELTSIHLHYLLDYTMCVISIITLYILLQTFSSSFSSSSYHYYYYSYYHYYYPSPEVRPRRKSMTTTSRS